MDETKKASFTFLSKKKKMYFTPSPMLSEYTFVFMGELNCKSSFANLKSLVTCSLVSIMCPYGDVFLLRLL